MYNIKYMINRNDATMKENRKKEIIHIDNIQQNGWYKLFFISNWIKCQSINELNTSTKDIYWGNVQNTQKTKHDQAMLSSKYALGSKKASSGWLYKYRKQ